MARPVKNAAGRLLEVVSDHDPRGMTVRTTSSDRTRLTGRSRSTQPLVIFSAREAAFSHACADVRAAVHLGGACLVQWLLPEWEGRCSASRAPLRLTWPNRRRPRRRR